jgi:hypothetical protein
VNVFAGSKLAIIGLVFTVFGFPRIKGSDLSSFLLTSPYKGANFSPPISSTFFGGSFYFFSLSF